MAVLKVSKDDFEKEVLSSDKKVLCDFYADWCGPCRALRGTVEEIADEMDSSVKTVSVNIDEEEELAELYGVNAIPCLVVFENGEEKTRSVGLRPKDDIVAMLGK